MANGYIYGDPEYWYERFFSQQKLVIWASTFFIFVFIFNRNFALLCFEYFFIWVGKKNPVAVGNLVFPTNY